MARVLRIVDKASDSTDELKVSAGQNERGFFLDCFTVGNDSTTSWHGRIWADGTVENLENFEGQFGFPLHRDDPDKTAAERQRILDHNTRVAEVLRAKGFK